MLNLLINQTVKVALRATIMRFHLKTHMSGFFSCICRERHTKIKCLLFLARNKSASNLARYGLLRPRQLFGFFLLSGGDVMT